MGCGKRQTERNIVQCKTIHVILNIFERQTRKLYNLMCSTQIYAETSKPTKKNRFIAAYNRINLTEKLLKVYLKKFIWSHLSIA